MTKTLFSEAPAWKAVDGEWRRLYGSFSKQGCSVEWHDFENAAPLDWAKSFHPGSFEICLNLEGSGTLRGRRSSALTVNPRTATHYRAESGQLMAERHADERHRFLTLEFSRDGLASAVSGCEDGLSNDVKDYLEGRRGGATRQIPLTPRLRRSAEEMIRPPLGGGAATLWYQAKIFEVTAQVLYQERELFCERQKRIARDRVDRVKQVLSRDLENPPSLSVLGKEIGCSPFYLSRVFSEHNGMTISRYLRNLRLERAAELLRTGDHNVTEAAMAVGYSSLSHFSKAFAELYGACPCVFPLTGKS